MSPTLTAPRLTDGVVLLRPPVPDDAPAVTAACQDPEMARFTALPSPYELHHATDWVTRASEAWRDGTATPMVVVDASTGELLGACSLLDVKDGRAEIGYWVKREAQGRGVATRAVRVLTEWALGDLVVSRIELLADVRNIASQRVAEKAGYVREGEVPPPARCAGRCQVMARFVRSRIEPAGPRYHR